MSNDLSNRPQRMTARLARVWSSFATNQLGFAASQSGATSIEYGLIAALMGVAIIASLTAVGNSTTGGWGSMANKVVTAMTSK